MPSTHNACLLSKYKIQFRRGACVLHLRTQRNSACLWSIKMTVITRYSRGQHKFCLRKFVRHNLKFRVVSMLPTNNTPWTTHDPTSCPISRYQLQQPSYTFVHIRTHLYTFHAASGFHILQNVTTMAVVYFPRIYKRSFALTSPSSCDSQVVIAYYKKSNRMTLQWLLILYQS